MYRASASLHVVKQHFPPPLGLLKWCATREQAHQKQVYAVYDTCPVYGVHSLHTTICQSCVDSKLPIIVSKKANDSQVTNHSH